MRILFYWRRGVTPDWFDDLGISIQERPAHTHALVFNAVFPGRQAGCAFERFTQHGPLAVLPLPSTHRHEQRFNVVWSVSETEVDALIDLSDEQFCGRLQEAFGWRLGAVSAVGRRSQWPLVRSLASEQWRAGFLLVGNAAHTLHPVAGQGLNLSLREADLLAKTLIAAVTSGQPLSPYQQFARVSDSSGGRAAVSGEQYGFTGHPFLIRGVFCSIVRAMRRWHYSIYCPVRGHTLLA